MNEKDKMLLAERLVILQALAENYLKKTTGKTFEEMYPEEKDEYGRLNHTQEKVLHDYLASIYKVYGQNLDEVLAEKGETLKDGEVLTDYEKGALMRLADEQLILSATIVERKARLFNK